WTDGTGDWNNAANWSSNPALPSNTSDVVIGSGKDVTHSSGSHTVQSLSSASPFNLIGGSLAVSGALTNTGSFVVGPASGPVSPPTTGAISRYHVEGNAKDSIGSNNGTTPTVTFGFT